MEQTESNLLHKSGKAFWIPRKERPWVFAAIGIAAIMVFMGLWKIFHLSPADLHTRSFKNLFKNYGSLARIALFFVLAGYVFTLILQERLVDRWNSIKQWLIPLSRLARRWHTPLAILAIGLILLHIAGAFIYGITLDFSNISGLLALSALLPVPVAGLFRYRRMDRQWHLRFGLTFAVLFFIHAFL